MEFARDFDYKVNVAIVAFRIGARKVVFQTPGARDCLYALYVAAEASDDEHDYKRVLQAKPYILSKEISTSKSKLL